MRLQPYKPETGNGGVCHVRCKHCGASSRDRALYADLDGETFRYTCAPCARRRDPDCFIPGVYAPGDGSPDGPVKEMAVAIMTREDYDRLQERANAITDGTFMWERIGDYVG